VFPYDPALLEAISAPARTISEVLAGMGSMQAVLVDGDGLKWFNWLYLQVTEAVAGEVAAGRFSNREWLTELDVQFANLYFDALRTHLSGRRAPGCWRAVFGQRNQAPIARIQFAMAGINAHINRDLPVAVVNTCKATGTAPVHDSAEYADYTAVNPTLEGLIASARSELHVRLLGDALPHASHLENTLGAWSVDAAREAAWTNAEILWGLRPLKPLSERFLQSLDGLTALAGKTLLSPVP
jgi:hypothetical protein